MGARVLVVDDDPWILRMVTATLQKKDFVVDTAREGRQALERAQANPPDVIISDVMMPVMDGWTFVQRLRGIPRLAAVPVIFLTALGKDEAKLRSLGMGPDDFLPKPFRFEELEKRVSAALQNSAASAGPPGSGGPLGAPGQPGPDHQSGVHAMPGYPAGYPYGAPGYPPGAPQHGVPPHPHPNAPQGMPPQGMPPQGMPPQGLPPQGMPPRGIQQPPPGQGGQFGPPGYPPGYAPPYASGYTAPNYQPGPFAPYPGAAEPSKTPVRPPVAGAPPPQAAPLQAAPLQAAPPQAAPLQAAPPQAPQAQAAPAAAPAEGEFSAPPSAGPDQRLPPITPGDIPGTRRTTALNGRLEQLGLSSLLVMMEMERKDGVLSLRDSDTAMVGRIFLRKGQVISAKLDQLPDKSGKECVYAMLAWQVGTFSFSATKVDMEDTINASTTHLLMEGARLIDEAKRDDHGDDYSGDFL